jgi:hypothetical protein
VRCLGRELTEKCNGSLWFSYNLLENTIIVASKLTKPPQNIYVCEGIYGLPISARAPKRIRQTLKDLLPTLYTVHHSYPICIHRVGFVMEFALENFEVSGLGFVHETEEEVVRRDYQLKIVTDGGLAFHSSW